MSFYWLKCEKEAVLYAFLLSAFSLAMMHNHVGRFYRGTIFQQPLGELLIRPTTSHVQLLLQIVEFRFVLVIVHVAFAQIHQEAGTLTASLQRKKSN